MNKRYLLVYICLLFSSAMAVATDKRDTCIYGFVENSSLANLSKLVSLEKLIEANSKKDFYIGVINLTMGNNRSVNVRECSSFEDKKIILFNGSVSNFDFHSLKVDTSILFNKVEDRKTITYQAYSKSGGNSHADTKVLVLKLDERILIGYSIDGCDLLKPLEHILNTHFIFTDDKSREQLKFILTSITK